MRTIIAGSRSCTEYGDLLKAIASMPWKPTVVLSGTARGVDQMGERWATENDVPIEYFPANWSEHGKSAGYRRNAEMAKQADALLAIWDSSSRGTKHMIDLAREANLTVFVLEV